MRSSLQSEEELNRRGEPQAEGRACAKALWQEGAKREETGPEEAKGAGA